MGVRSCPLTPGSLLEYRFSRSSIPLCRDVVFDGEHGPRLGAADPVQAGNEHSAADNVACGGQAQVVGVSTPGDRLAVWQEQAEEQAAHVCDAMLVAAGDE